MKKIALMQPYWFPYIGYFQLINKVDEFVVYNDVRFIERGWANRNNFLINKEAKMLTLPLIKASASKLFNEIEINVNNKQYGKVVNTIKQNYTKAPFYKDILDLFLESLNNIGGRTIDQVCLRSFKLINEYLELNTKLTLSSNLNYNRNSNKVEKINEIGKLLDTDEILFPSGSKELYNQSDFPDFRTYSLIPKTEEYNQLQNKFVPNLSFLDVLMFNSKSEVVEMLSKFELKKL